MRRRRQRAVKEPEIDYDLMRYAEIAYKCADTIWRDAFDVRANLGEEKFNKIQKAAEEIIRTIGPHLPL